MKKAEAQLKAGRSDEFYAEISKAVHGYFADKLDISEQKVSLEAIEQARAPIWDEIYQEIIAAFNRVHH